ncbi:MAG: hypothetical protein ACOYXN_12675 [Acidobacteriota bacterium]
MFRPPLKEPWKYPARLTWWLGWLALVPLAAPVAASVAACTALVSHFLCTRWPERYTGKNWIWAGLGLCILALALFFAEGFLFLSWKQDQLYAQNLAVSRFRLTRIAEALERHREEVGHYPEVSGIHRLKALLEPKYVADCPTRDGFEGSISAWSRFDGYRLEAHPSPRRDGTRPAPLVAEGHFQPGPSPPPPPPPPLEEAPAEPSTSPAPRE